MLEIILLVLVSALLGTALGIFTGLTPGIHVNTVAMILLSLSPLAAELLEGLLGMEGWLTLLMVGSLIVATSMAHTFLDFIPSTFLGAPEPETALSVLPAHGMLMEGRGYRAVYLSAVGSFGAVVVGFMLLLPYRFVVNEPVNGYRFLKEYMVWALIAVVLLTLCTETARLPYRPVKHPGRGFHLEKGPFSRFFGIAAALSLFLLRQASWGLPFSR